MKNFFWFYLFLLPVWSWSQAVYKIIPEKSTFHWKCDKHYGTFPVIKGIIKMYDESNVEGEFEIDVEGLAIADLDSIQYKTAKAILENTLKNEFLETDKYPVARFYLYRIIPQSGGQYLLEGDVFLHGQKVCLQIPVQIKQTGHQMEVIAPGFVIDRTDWGIYRMSPSRPYSDDENNWTVPDEVEIKFHLILKKTGS